MEDIRTFVSTPEWHAFAARFSSTSLNPKEHPIHPHDWEYVNAFINGLWKLHRSIPFECDVRELVSEPYSIAYRARDYMERYNSRYGRCVNCHATDLPTARMCDKCKFTVCHACSQPPTAFGSSYAIECPDCQVFMCHDCVHETCGEEWEFEMDMGYECYQDAFDSTPDFAEYCRRCKRIFCDKCRHKSEFCINCTTTVTSIEDFVEDDD